MDRLSFLQRSHFTASVLPLPRPKLSWGATVPDWASTGPFLGIGQLIEIFQTCIKSGIPDYGGIFSASIHTDSLQEYIAALSFFTWT